MLKKDVKTGESYLASLNGRMTIVRLDREDTRFGGWHAINERTGRQVRIKSAQKLRKPATDRLREIYLAPRSEQRADRVADGRGGWVESSEHGTPKPEPAPKPDPRFSAIGLWKLRTDSENVHLLLDRNPENGEWWIHVHRNDGEGHINDVVGPFTRPYAARLIADGLSVEYVVPLEVQS